MSTVFPTNLDSFTTKLDGVSDVLAVDTNNIQDSIVALQSKIGVDNSSVVTSIDYKIRNLPVLGVNQTWQVVERSTNVWYQNTTGKPIGVYAYGSIGGAVVWRIGPSTTNYVTISMGDGDGGDSADYGWIVVPPLHYYMNTDTWNDPRELR